MMTRRAITPWRQLWGVAVALALMLVLVAAAASPWVGAEPKQTFSVDRATLKRGCLTPEAKEGDLRGGGLGGEWFERSDGSYGCRWTGSRTGDKKIANCTADEVCTIEPDRNPQPSGKPATGRDSVVPHISREALAVEAAPDAAGTPPPGQIAEPAAELETSVELTVSGTPTPGEIAVPAATLETTVEFGGSDASTPEHVVGLGAELETSVEFTGAGTPTPESSDGGNGFSGRPNLVVASYRSDYDAGRGQWRLDVTVENTGLGDAGPYTVEVLTAGGSSFPSFTSDGLAAKTSQTFHYPLTGCEFNGEIVVYSTNTGAEADRTWATIIC